MLEYFTYKKVKKYQAAKHAREAALKSPVLHEEDERFLERIISAEGTPPPLPQRPIYLNRPEVGDSNGNDGQLVAANQLDDSFSSENKDPESKNTDKGKGKETDTDPKRASRFGFFRRGSKKQKSSPTSPVTPGELETEEDDINRVLDELNLAAVNNRAFSVSKESNELVQKFTVVLKDLVNGVPTAYDDLVGLLEDSQGTLAKSYDSLPAFLQKLITQLPNKLTSTLAPELLAVAAEAQALNAGSATAAGSGGLKAAAAKFLTPTSLKDLVSKPGAIAGMLKTIMNALKLRWPAFMGTNVLLSLGLFILLFVFWYCHKRGREVRLEKERTVDSEGRIVELDDDPMLGNVEGNLSAGAAADTAAPAVSQAAQTSGSNAHLLREDGHELHERRKREIV